MIESVENMNLGSVKGVYKRSLFVLLVRGLLTIFAGAACVVEPDGSLEVAAAHLGVTELPVAGTGAATTMPTRAAIIVAWRGNSLSFLLVIDACGP